MRELYLRVGKFVYPRGSSVQAHFMALQDFSLEPALNYSLLIALRMAWSEGKPVLLDKIEIAQWRDRLLTAEVPKLVDALTLDDPVFIDVGGQDGVIFEEFKMAWAACEHKPAYRVVIAEADSKSRFTVLHLIDDWQYTVETALGEVGPRDVVLYNSVVGLRGGQPLPDLEDISLSEAQGCVLALRACSPSAQNTASRELSHYTRTTVQGRDVSVPTVAHAEAWMRRSRFSWRFRWLPRHDTGFFIPEEGIPDVGVLLAYGSKAPRAVSGYRLLST